MKSVVVDKKTYPVAFNMAAHQDIEEMTGVSITEFYDQITNMPPGRFLKLLYLGLKYGADEARKKFTLTYSEFAMWQVDHPDAIQELSDIVVADFKALNELMNEKVKLRSGPEVSEDEPKKTIGSGLTTSDA